MRRIIFQKRTTLTAAQSRTFTIFRLQNEQRFQLYIQIVPLVGFQFSLLWRAYHPNAMSVMKVLRFTYQSIH